MNDAAGPPPPPGLRRQIPTIAVTALVTTIVTLTVTGAWGAVGDWLSGTDPYADDVARIAAEATKESRFIAVDSELPDDADARLIVLRHRASIGEARQGLVRNAETSDEVRIYRQVESDLTLDFRFQPTPQRSRDLQGERALSPYLFDPSMIDDIDDDGEPEVVGAFYFPAMEPVFPRPVVLARDTSDTPYSLTPLTGGYDSTPFPSEVSGACAKGKAENYAAKPILQDALGDLKYQASATEGYGVVDSTDSGFPVLITAYVKKQDACADAATIVTHTQRVEPTPGGGFVTYPCTTHVPLFVRATTDLNAEVVDHWRGEVDLNGIADDCTSPEPLPPE